MTKKTDANPPRSALPGIDELLRDAGAALLIDAYGRDLVATVARESVDRQRAALAGGQPATITVTGLLDDIAARLAALMQPTLVPVLNLTGTVLHTNLGRAPLPEEAISAMVAVAGGASNLEFDLARGRRGDRDSLVEDWICRLTGAEAATVVNNNAAAVLLVLNTLAQRREVPVSRGELVEIGGAFRVPDVMARAGAKLVEVGTTNRTHRADFEQAIGPRTAALMKVHTSNYVIEGFTAAVAERELATLAHAHDLPFVVDLGSGTLVDMAAFGLPREPTVGEALAAGADLVTFSGDKLLGGPQCGIVAGGAELVRRVKKNPLKRALRVDKLTLAALGAVLRLYADPATLAARLPTLRLLTRAASDIRAQAERLRAPLANALGDGYDVAVIDCTSQIGSGALPVESLPSAGLAIRRPAAGGRAPERLAARFRALPLPVVGRVADGAFVLDLRCLDNEAGFTDQLPLLGDAEIAV
ncbi:MAG: L-seryl-tRNA(Sec) selenium transferase [Gammaproteobacteria bacterium]